MNSIPHIGHGTSSNSPTGSNSKVSLHPGHKKVIECEEPLPDEIEATREFDVSKKEKTLQIAPWKKASKGA